VPLCSGYSAMAVLFLAGVAIVHTAETNVMAQRTRIPEATDALHCRTTAAGPFWRTPCRSWAQSTITTLLRSP
jgi:hypothetical protein